MPVDRVDDAALVDEHVVELDRAARRKGWRLWHEGRDFLRLIRVGNVVGAQAAVEERADDDRVGVPRGRQRYVFVDVVRAETPALPGECVVGQGTRRDRYR